MVTEVSLLSEIEKAKGHWRSHEDQKAIDVLNVATLETSSEAFFTLGRIYNWADRSVGGLSRRVPKVSLN